MRSHWDCLRAYPSVGRVRNFLDLLLIPVVGFICVVRVWNLFNLNLHSFIIAAVILYGLKSIFLDNPETAEVRFDLMDVALLLVVLVEVVSFLTSTYRPNSFGYLLNVLFLFLFYYLVKFHLTREVQKAAVFWVITVLGLVLSGIAFYAVWLQYRELQSMGFTDTTNFKTSGSSDVLFFFYLANPGLLPPGELITVLKASKCRLVEVSTARSRRHDSADDSRHLLQRTLYRDLRLFPDRERPVAPLPTLLLEKGAPVQRRIVAGNLGLSRHPQAAQGARLEYSGAF
jgi:hypothetical protein